MHFNLKYYFIILYNQCHFLNNLKNQSNYLFCPFSGKERLSAVLRNHHQRFHARDEFPALLNWNFNEKKHLKFLCDEF